MTFSRNTKTNFSNKHFCHVESVYTSKTTKKLETCKFLTLIKF